MKRDVILLNKPSCSVEQDQQGYGLLGILDGLHLARPKITVPRNF